MNSASQKLRPWSAAMLCAGLSLASASAVNAQESTPSPAALATRRELIRQAVEARVRSDFRRAIELAESAGHIQMTPSLRLFLAQQLNSAGMFAEAYGYADTCMRESGLAARNQEAIRASCETMARELRTRVGNVVVRVLPETARSAREFRVRVAGTPLDPALLGLPYVVTPGSVRVQVQAAGFLAQEREVTVAAQATQELTIQLEVDPASVVRTPAPTPVVPPPVVPEEPPRPLIVPWILVGVGGAIALVGGGFFIGSALTAASDCPNDVCPDEAALDTVIGFDYLGSISLGTGLTVATAGLLWGVLGAPQRRSPARAMRVEPSFGRGPAVLVRW